MKRKWIRAALAVLCAALVYYNFLDPNIRKAEAPAGEPAVADVEAPAQEAAPEDWSSSAPLGCEVGQQLPDFTITCVDGSEFHLADCRGKPVFINLWATYCGPCVKELPHFSELYKAHEGDIAMLALHSDIVADDPQEYLDEFCKDWAMPFAVENDDEVIWDLVGGTTAMPQTIVLNRHGEVVYNQRGSVTPEMLDTLYEQAGA